MDGSDNPFGADNQQERPSIEQWIVGFVDGEGCFSVPVFKNRTYKIGWQVQPDFVVVQGARSVDVLHDLKRFFGCGDVFINRRYDNHREHLYRYSVRNLAHLEMVIVPFFETNPLRTAKASEFQKFARVVRMMREKLHLTVEGLTQIAQIAQTMNHRKPSRFLESSEAIRRAPQSKLVDEEMVRAPWRHGEDGSEL